MVPWNSNIKTGDENKSDNLVRAEKHTGVASTEHSIPPGDDLNGEGLVSSTFFVFFFGCPHHTRSSRARDQIPAAAAATLTGSLTQCTRLGNKLVPPQEKKLSNLKSVYETRCITGIFTQNTSKLNSQSTKERTDRAALPPGRPQMAQCPECTSVSSEACVSAQ